jgi:hypothetical protein
MDVLYINPRRTIWTKMDRCHFLTLQICRVLVNQGCELFQELPLGSAWLSSSWSHICPPPSFSKYHPCMFLISFFPPSLLIFEFLQLSPSPQMIRSRSIAQHLLSSPSPPLLLVATPYSLLYSRSTHLFFTFCFLNFAPLVDVGANGVVFFKKKLYWIKCLLHFCLLLVVVSTPLFFYWCILEVSWGSCFVVGFYLLLPSFWYKCRMSVMESSILSCAK